VSISYKIAFIHWIIIVISMLMFISPLGQKSGAIHPLLIVPFFYSVLSLLPPLVGLVYGVVEKYKNSERRRINIGIFLNTLYVILFISFVSEMWEGWMGI